MEEKPVVFVIDDDASIRKALSNLLKSVGFDPRPFASAQDFLKSTPPHVPSCIVSDIRMPGLSGLDLQHELAKAKRWVPIVFITGHGDIPMSVRAMKSGAVDFLAKPFREQDLLDAVKAGIERDAGRRKNEGAVSDVRRRFETLTRREQEVMKSVVNGLLNKQIASSMGLSEVTVKVHRSHLMRKMQAKSLAELIHMANLLGMTAAAPNAPHTGVLVG
ncbi:MAG: response regulator transcription factor [Rhodospirillaceae bacterium]